MVENTEFDTELPSLSPEEQVKLIEDNKMLRDALKVAQANKPVDIRALKAVTLDTTKIKLSDAVRIWNSAKGKKLQLVIENGEVKELKP